MPYDFRFGPPDELIETLRRFGDATGHRPWISASDFAEFVGDTYPTVTESQAMEFLWAATPLRYREHPEPMEDICTEIADFLEFTEHQFGVDLKGARRVAADRARFADRWMRLHVTPLPVWLEELRLEMAILGLSCSIPAADPADPQAVRLAAQLIPGPQGLSFWRPEAPDEPGSDESEAMRTADALAHVAALMSIVGAGTKLTPKGNLRLADGKALAEAMGSASCSTKPSASASSGPRVPPRSLRWS